ncbi:MAG TPA: diacylglycerol kinase family protein [bacterium]|nr:diacylglycerol kinase family protein [bacterium]
MWSGLHRAFTFAFDGLRHALRTQRTFRLHLAIAAVITMLVIWLPLSSADAAVVVIAMAAVLVAELFNTAVEAVVDLLVERNHSQVAKVAKDVAAAGVLITAVAAAVAGTLILGAPLAVAVGVSAPTAATLARVTALVLILLGAGGLVRLTRQHRSGTQVLH